MSKKDKNKLFQRKKIGGYIYEGSVTIKNPTKRDTIKYFVKSF